MRKWALPLLFMITLLIPVGVRAQDAITLSTLLIQIWPEYDKPGVLVINDLTLPGTLSLPAAVSIRIPKSAGEPYAVAVRQVDGSLYNMDYTRQIAGDWATISFTSASPEIRLEYYDPQLSIEGNARHYEYVWPGDYAVTDLTIRVQQPSGVTDMRISPSFGTGDLGADNLTYYSQNVGAITAGQNIRVTLDYQKSDDRLSVENQPLQPSASVSEGTVRSINFTTWLPWIVALVGASLIIGSIYWFWRTGRQRSVPKNRRRRLKPVAAEREVAIDSAEAVIYCSQCGKRAAPGDQFCRSCGTQFRAK